jgi:hypothetical protein
MEPIDTISYKNMTIKIYVDEATENPRTSCDGWIGKMVCWHRCYKLGDEQPRYEPGEWLRHLAAELVDANDAELIPDEHVRRILAKHCVILPLYLYDHGGITLSYSKFSCPWDSGQVGYIYATKETIDKEFGGDFAKAATSLQSEVDTYDDYLTGNCYGYAIADEQGDDVDSCWGFLGDSEYCESEAKSVVDHLVKQANYSI